MTSNLGMQELTMQAAKIGFAEKDESKTNEQEKLKVEYEKIKDGVMEMMRQEMRPEFLNRIDKIIVFRPLGVNELKAITKLQLMELQNRLLDQQVQLKVSAGLIKFISDKSFDPAQGARFVRKNIQELLEDQLAEKIISGEAKPGSLISADVKKDKIVFAIKKPNPQKVAIPVA